MKSSNIPKKKVLSTLQRAEKKVGKKPSTQPEAVNNVKKFARPPKPPPSKAIARFKRGTRVPLAKRPISAPASAKTSISTTVEKSSIVTSISASPPKAFASGSREADFEIPETVIIGGLQAHLLDVEREAEREVQEEQKQYGLPPPTLSMQVEPINHNLLESSISVPESPDAVVPSIGHDSSIETASSVDEASGNLSDTDGVSEKLTEFITDNADEDDVQFGLRNTASENFTAARFAENKRLGAIHTIQMVNESIAQKLEYCCRKTEDRIKELQSKVTEQEKTMSVFRLAFKNATDREINEMMTAGWSRSGNLGFIDLKQTLEPFVKSRQDALYAVALHTQQLTKPLPLGATTKEVRSKFQFQIKPAPPKIRKPKNRFPCTACFESTNNKNNEKKLSFLFLCKDSRSQSTSDYEDRLSSETSSIPSSFETSHVHPLKVPLSKRRSSFPVTSKGFHIDRKQISAFVNVALNQSFAQSKNPENTNNNSYNEDKNSSSTSSLSSVDKEYLENIVSKIHSPKLCGMELTSPLSHILQIPIEDTEVYKAKVLRKCHRYFREVKQYRKQCISCLPGGLSLVRLKQPPSPRYPEEGLITPEESSSLASEEVMSEIFSEFDENNPEVDFAAILGRGEQELIEQAVRDFGFVSDSSKNYATSPSIKKTAFTHGIGEIFTTTVELNYPDKTPEIIGEFHNITESTHDKTLISKSDKNITNEQHISNVSSQEYCNNSLSKCNCSICLWKQQPLDMYIDEAEVHIPSSVSPTPVKIIEFWQLADDKGEPVWIFRGRTLTSF